MPSLAWLRVWGTVARDFATFGDAVRGIVAVDDIDLVDLLRPPSQPGEAVADTGIRGIGIEPLSTSASTCLGLREPADGSL